MQYHRLLCPLDGVCLHAGWEGWTDYAPFSLQVAGMLNMPVAVFAQPLYHIVHDGTSKWELLALLVGVVLQWLYIGAVIDSRRTVRVGSSATRIASLLDCIFSVVVFLATPLYHVGIMFQLASVIWSILLFRPFLRMFRLPFSTQQHRVSG